MGDRAQRSPIGDALQPAVRRARIRRVVQSPDRTSAFAQYTILVEQRERVADALLAAGIPTAVHYPAPISAQPAYRDLSIFGELPSADLASRQVLSLPMHADLDEATQDRIVDEVVRAVSAG